MRLLQAIFILFIIQYTVPLRAQDSIAVLSGNLLEDLLENNDESSYDFFTLFDDLQAYLKNPLNINSATFEDFQDLQMLSEIQISEIIAYREDYGPFISVYELQTIPSLDIGTLKALIPLVTEGGERKNHSLKSILAESTSTAFFKYKNVLQDRKGFSDGSYLGDPSHLFARYNFASGQNVRAAITMEKDPGEQFFTGSNKNGFDYYSGFIHFRDVLPVFKVLNLGDYSVSMGQGLIAHNNFGGGKSSYVVDVKKGGRPIRPYSSVNEVNFFRGIAGTLDLSEQLELTFFGSHKKLDGRVELDTFVDTGFERFSTIIVDGFHRTQSEINNKNTVSLDAYGGILKYKKGSLSIAVNALQQNFSAPLQNNDQLYKIYRFDGNQLTNLSLDYGYRIKNFNFFGEFARSNNGGTALISGLLTTLGRDVDATFIFRNFGKDYQVLDANAFSESTLPINERGLYFGLKFRATKDISISTYYDIWSHPWLRFLKDAPSRGREFLLKVEYNKKRQLDAYFQYRYEEKQRNGSFDDIKIDPLITTGQHRARLHVSNTLNKHISLRSRFEFTFFKKDKELTSGYMLFQDIIYRPTGKSYSFSARYALFDTDGFDTRIYTYENDIAYEFSIPFYSYKGSRYYLNWRQNFGRHISLELRYAATYYDNLESIGSSGQLIVGSKRSEIKAQLRYKF